MEQPRSALRAVYVLIALAACTSAHAINEGASSAKLQKLVGDARVSLVRLNQFADAFELDLMRGVSQTEMRGGRQMEGLPTYRDLDRESDQLTTIASQISGMISRCGPEGSKMGNGVRSAARRIKYDIDRMSSLSTTVSPRMQLDKLRGDIDLAVRDFMPALQMQGCVHESENKGDEDDAKEDDGEKEDKPSES